MTSSIQNRERNALAGPINTIASPSALELFAIAAVGGALIGLSRRGRGATLARLAGVALVGVAARPFVTAAVTRAGARRRNIAFQSSVEIERPVADVFAFFKDFENFPRVVGAVRSVAPGTHAAVLQESG